jgi:hypothetical protein
MNKTLKTLLVAVGITASTLASAATVVDRGSYTGGVGTCKAVVRWAWINNIANPDIAARVEKQIDARWSLLQGQDLSQAVGALNRAQDLLPRATKYDIITDFSDCMIWANGNGNR